MFCSRALPRQRGTLDAYGGAKRRYVTHATRKTTGLDPARGLVPGGMVGVRGGTESGLQGQEAGPRKNINLPVHDTRRESATEKGLDSIGWDTFRHSYRTLLSGVGAAMDVQQKLLRHAQMFTTEQYGGPPMENLRQADSDVNPRCSPESRLDNTAKAKSGACAPDFRWVGILCWNP